MFSMRGIEAEEKAIAAALAAAGKPTQPVQTGELRPVNPNVGSRPVSPKPAVVQEPAAQKSVQVAKRFFTP
jgi:hypothetical protein